MAQPVLDSTLGDFTTSSLSYTTTSQTIVSGDMAIAIIATAGTGPPSVANFYDSVFGSSNPYIRCGVEQTHPSHPIALDAWISPGPMTSANRTFTLSQNNASGARFYVLCVKNLASSNSFDQQPAANVPNSGSTACTSNPTAGLSFNNEFIVAAAAIQNTHGGGTWSTFGGSPGSWSNAGATALTTTYPPLAMTFTTTSTGAGNAFTGTVDYSTNQPYIMSIWSFADSAVTHISAPLPLGGPPRVQWHWR